MYGLGLGEKVRIFAPLGLFGSKPLKPRSGRTGGVMDANKSGVGRDIDGEGLSKYPIGEAKRVSDRVEARVVDRSLCGVHTKVTGIEYETGHNAAMMQEGQSRRPFQYPFIKQNGEAQVDVLHRDLLRIGERMYVFWNDHCHVLYYMMMQGRTLPLDRSAP
jgi:hypothetical protein